MTIPKPSESLAPAEFPEGEIPLTETADTALSAISYQHLKGLPHASLFADPIIRIILISTDDASVYE
jgi:hypothetical protein